MIDVHKLLPRRSRLQPDTYPRFGRLGLRKPSKRNHSVRPSAFAKCTDIFCITLGILMSWRLSIKFGYLFAASEFVLALPMLLSRGRWFVCSHLNIPESSKDNLKLLHWKTLATFPVGVFLIFLQIYSSPEKFPTGVSVVSGLAVLTSITTWPLAVESVCTSNRFLKHKRIQLRRRQHLGDIKRINRPLISVTSYRSQLSVRELLKNPNVSSTRAHKLATENRRHRGLDG